MTIIPNSHLASNSISNETEAKCNGRDDNNQLKYQGEKVTSSSTASLNQPYSIEDLIMSHRANKRQESQWDGSSSNVNVVTTAVTTTVTIDPETAYNFKEFKDVLETEKLSNDLIKHGVADEVTLKFLKLQSIKRNINSNNHIDNDNDNDDDDNNNNSNNNMQPLTRSSSKSEDMKSKLAKTLSRTLSNITYVADIKDCSTKQNSMYKSVSRVSNNVVHKEKDDHTDTIQKLANSPGLNDTINGESGLAEDTESIIISKKIIDELDELEMDSNVSDFLVR